MPASHHNLLELCHYASAFTRSLFNKLSSSIRNKDYYLRDLQLSVYETVCKRSFQVYFSYAGIR